MKVQLFHPLFGGGELVNMDLIAGRTLTWKPKNHYTMLWWRLRRGWGTAKLGSSQEANVVQVRGGANLAVHRPQNDISLGRC
ncbi:hypothetical protein CRG98_008446 [Punica granatum]|uniref:Uncharacterized protein n=1 Tax=Punica granatum TaxID=22663 RepID=A0A2I0KRP1_PUNGR|nr:hypothetical protein CRG98_008446 [Punica granatum]